MRKIFFERLAPPRVMGFGLVDLLSSILAFLIFLAAVPARATQVDEQVWMQHFWQGPSEWKVRPAMETQGRLNDAGRRLEQILIRPSVVYSLTDHSSLWAGFGWTPTFLPRYNREVRLWQQYQHHFRLDLSSISSVISRTRLEQRSVDGASSIGWRIRQMLRLHFPFPGISSPDWQLALWDELFWNLNDLSVAVPAGFYQNRLLVGPYIKLHDKLFLELGYLTVYSRRPVTENRMVHGLLVALYSSL